MLEDRTVAVVVPCYNEQTQVERVLTGMPDFVDCIIVVDDGSRDGTAEAVRRTMGGSDPENRVVLIEHEQNRGVGAAIATGYKEALKRGIDVTAVMAGDGQMDPDELALLVGPVARGEAEYAKGNRLFYQGAWGDTPKHRYMGNAFLSMLTKIASGYWHVADSQTGFTAISRRALELIDLDRLYPRYGYPNDLLVRLNVYDLRVADVHVRPVYNVGERSKMRLWHVVPTLSWLIVRRFLWRLKEKYVVRDFHPLVLFYGAAGFFTASALVLFVRLIWVWASTADIPDMNALLWAMCVIASIQLGLFAMWFDMEMNRHLRIVINSQPRPACPLPPDEPPDPSE